MLAGLHQGCLLIGIESEHDVVARGSRCGLFGGVAIGSQVQLVGHISALDSVDGLEHGDMEHRGHVSGRVAIIVLWQLSHLPSCSNP